MVRTLSVVMVSASLAAPAAAQTVSKSESWRIADVPSQIAERQMPSVNVGSTGRFGPGMFGLKSQMPRSRAVVGHEVSTPKQRRAGVGFSLKF